MPHNSRKIEKKYLYALLGGLMLIVIIMGVALFSLSPYADVFQPETPGEKTTSTFTLLSYDMNDEDVSNFVEITVKVPKSTATFDDTEDIFTLSNFEDEESSKDADDVAIDLRDYSYVWIEVDPDGESPYANDFRLIYGGVNYDYTIYVYHQTSDVNFNLLDRDTLNEITVADYQTNGNYTLIFDCPHHTTSNIHANSDDWDVDDEEWDDMTESEKAEYYDEKNWRVQAPVYDPAVDTEKDYDKDLEKLTNAFAFKITCNGTISTVDGNTAQLNITIDDEAPIEVVISGEIVYLIYYELISFEDGPRDLDMELAFGTHITLSDIDSGRLVVPKDDEGLGAFSKYSDIAA